MSFPLNHDLHFHTYLSSCSEDPEQNKEYIVKFAEENNFSSLCFTDHFWDEDVPGPNGFYAIQGWEHVRQILPLPESKKVRVMFGVETEYCGNGRIAITRERMENFDFVVIPPNHFHFRSLTRDQSYDTPLKVAKLFGDRLYEIANLDLPMEKCGIAHINCRLLYSEGSHYEVLRLVDKVQLRETFAAFAERGTGIELNDSSFQEEQSVTDENLELFYIAHEAGCKFYRGSDAHHPKVLPIGPFIGIATQKLGLTENDLYVVPGK